MPLTVTPHIIQTMPLFTGISAKERNHLVQEGCLHQFSRKQMVFSQGEPVKYFYIVVQGMVRLYRSTADGVEKTINIVKAGQTLCESEIFDTYVLNRMNAEAIEDTVLLELPSEKLKDMTKKYPVIALNLLAMISQQRYMAEVEAEHQAIMSASQIVACFLWRLSVHKRIRQGRFKLPYTKTLIASRLGMKLETFSRTLKTINGHGIRVEGAWVEIYNSELLAEYICHHCSVMSDCVAYKALQKEPVS